MLNGPLALRPYTRDTAPEAIGCCVLEPLPECPLTIPEWHATDYTLVINADRAGDDAVLAFEQWISTFASQSPGA